MRGASFSLALALLTGSVALAQHAAEEKKAADGEPLSQSHGGGDPLTKWKWVNFFILGGGLGYLIAKNAGPFFASRSREIRQGIGDAQKMREESEAQAAEMDARLRNLGADIEALRASAREEAAAEGERIRRDNERDFAKIQAQAEQEIASASKGAQTELKRYTAELAVGLARRKVQDRMSSADQDALVRDFVSGLGKSTQ